MAAGTRRLGQLLPPCRSRVLSRAGSAAGTAASPAWYSAVLTVRKQWLFSRPQCPGQDGPKKHHSREAPLLAHQQHVHAVERSRVGSAAAPAREQPRSTRPASLGARRSQGVRSAGRSRRALARRGRQGSAARSIRPRRAWLLAAAPRRTGGAGSLLIVAAAAVAAVATLWGAGGQPPPPPTPIGPAPPPEPPALLPAQPTRRCAQGPDLSAPGRPGATIVHSLISGDTNRSYRLRLPRAYDPRRPAPLVLAFHGFKNVAAEEEQYVGLSALTDTEYFAVAYPEGADGCLAQPSWRSWNAGGCSQPNGTCCTKVRAQKHASFFEHSRRFRTCTCAQSTIICQDRLGKQHKEMATSGVFRRLITQPSASVTASRPRPARRATAKPTAPATTPKGG